MSITSGGSAQGIVTLSDEWKEKIKCFKESDISGSNIVSSLEMGLKLDESSGNIGEYDQIGAVLKFFHSESQITTSIVQQSSSTATSSKHIKTDE